MKRVVLNAGELDGYLTAKDSSNLETLDAMYREISDSYLIISAAASNDARRHAEEKLINLYNRMGKLLQGICGDEDAINVYPFSSPAEDHGEASRLIAKLRDVRTGRDEFVYYIQRAYEMLFKLAYGGRHGSNKNYLIVKTPVTLPLQNYAVHKIPNVDDRIENAVMCVMLRGALLPSMIISKEIQEYSSHGYVTPFALFKIQRNDRKQENNMEYLLNLDRSYFDLAALDGRDLIFADPMNATGGSLITVVKYLSDQGVKPRSIQFFTVISALKGSLRVVRAIENCQVYTLWMDPALNEAAYILPGLGDAGDRINGGDGEENPRNIIQLVADFGSNIARLYRAQLREIEGTVLGTDA